MNVVVGPSALVCGDGVEDGLLPFHVTRDRTLRLKVLDACGMTCTFCHNEGTPVVADNLGRRSADFAARGRSGRTSLYLSTNGATFLPGTVVADGELAAALQALRAALDIEELHLTGGEPTLHPGLAGIVQAGRDSGLRVCMTSNGENAARVLPACGRAGLDRVNFSVFGTTPAELAAVQADRYADEVRAQRKLKALDEAVRVALEHNVGASANIVVPNYSHAPKVRRLLSRYAAQLSVRLLNSLDDGDDSVLAIRKILAELGAVPLARELTAGASGWRTSYRLPTGRVVHVKQIRPVRLPETCSGCRFNNPTDCHEGFYGVRLYRERAGGYLVGVCIRRMDLCLPVEDFVGSALCREIVRLREDEYLRLSAMSRVTAKA